MLLLIFLIAQHGAGLPHVEQLQPVQTGLRKALGGESPSAAAVVFTIHAGREARRDQLFPLMVTLANSPSRNTHRPVAAAVFESRDE
jgi:hypothetical protein